MRNVVPDAVADGDAQLASGLHEMIVACVDCGLSSIEQGAQWSEPIPPVVAAQARSAASSGVSLTTALRRCVASYTLAWRFVLDEVVRHDLPDTQRFALLRQVSEAMGSLLARVQTEIADAHTSEIRSRTRSHEQRRSDIVHKLLVSEPVGASELTELGYDFDAWHLCVIVTGGNAEKAVRRLAATHGREFLLIACGGEMWAWFGGQRKLTITDIERVLSAQVDADASVAVGEAARGLEGWCRTHQQAEAALLVARCRPRPLTRYLDVAPEANALQDEALASSLIETHLSPLDDMRIGGQAARRTLRALFDTEHNVSSAAHKLDVDRSTVHRRRNEIERRLGCRLHERQVNIEIALRVEDLLKRRDSAQLSAATS